MKCKQRRGLITKRNKSRLSIKDFYYMILRVCTNSGTMEISILQKGLPASIIEEMKKGTKRERTGQYGEFNI